MNKSVPDKATWELLALADMHKPQRTSTGRASCVACALPWPCMTARLADEIRRLNIEGTPGVMHEVDRAFYDLTVKERDFERHKVDRLEARVVASSAEIERLTALLADKGDPDA